MEYFTTIATNNGVGFQSLSITRTKKRSATNCDTRGLKPVYQNKRKCNERGRLLLKYFEGCGIIAEVRALTFPQTVSDDAIMDSPLLANLLSNLDTQLLGKPREVRLSLACVLARGHLLLEDVPGVGKTTLAKGLAVALGLESQRIQFTADLMPSEITGSTIFERATEQFVFHRGPLFTQIVIADEINRATPRTQSALLEAMAERMISIEGTSYRLDDTFTVIATQNPAHQIGTYPLPESQLDRFSMCLSLGYPDAEYEKKMLTNGSPVDAPRQDGKPPLAEWQRQVAAVHCSDELVAYLHRLISATRADPSISLGLSPRGGLQWLAVARAWAFIQGRDHVLPDDIQDVALSVVGHKCRSASSNSESTDQTLRRIIDSVGIYH